MADNSELETAVKAVVEAKKKLVELEANLDRLRMIQVRDAIDPDDAPRDRAA